MMKRTKEKMTNNKSMDVGKVYIAPVILFTLSLILTIMLVG